MTQNWRCWLGLHDWVYVAKATEADERSGGLAVDSGMTRPLYVRVCLRCSRAESTILEFRLRLENELARQREGKGQ